MTNETNYKPCLYKCNGATKDFPFDFQVHKNNELVVKLIQRDTKAETTLTENTDYTIKLEKVGGNVALKNAYDETYNIELSRDTSLLQKKSFSTSSGFQASEVENSFDRVSCALQDMDYNIETFKEDYSAETNQKIDDFKDEVNSKIEQVTEAVNQLHRLDEVLETCERYAVVSEEQSIIAQNQAVLVTDKATETLEAYESALSSIEATAETKKAELESIKNDVEDFHEEVIQGGLYKYQLFDTVLKDHILTYEESLGWALQGTYVYKEAVAGSRYGYPDFYTKCLEEYNEATGSETVNGVTIKVHENGHKFFDLADKDSIDEIYNSTGTAWYYGIDTENERIFLPRNVARVLVESKKATDDDPNWATDKYLYICVGNTTSESIITDVVDVTTTDNDTVPLFTGQYFDFTPNNVSWLKAGGQANSGGIYATCYNELVNELTTPKYGLKVIETSAMQSDVDYSEYWKVNQDDMTFTTPTAISNKALSGAVIGNGMTLGLTNGNVDLGLLGATSSSAPNTLHYGNPVAGQPVGTAYDVGTQYGNYSLGVTANAEKSGIIVEQSTAQLYFKVANAVENLELLDAGEVMSVLSEKISRQDCCSYVISSYVNGTSWYRIYSDGWCEQGGYISGITSAWITVSFLKPFKDISYYFNRCNNSNVTDIATNFANEGWKDKTTNGISCYNHLSYCTAFNWVACGYIEEA